MAKFALVSAVVATLLSSASAELQINNWCSVPVSIYLSHNGGCDYGSTGACGTSPWVINPSTILGFDWIADGLGTSVKISKEGVSGILQYEYTMSTGTYGGLYWDLSDLDGAGAGLVGTPFENDNVKVSPTGDGAGTGTCMQIRCAAGELCLDSYQNPDDKDTRYCPADTGDMWIDLCEPEAQFITKREAKPAPVAHVHAGRHLHRHAVRHLSHLKH